MGLREDNKVRRRRQIYERSLDLFRRRGFDGSTIREIVEPLHISEDTFFNYFPTKTAVLDALAVELVGTYVELLRGLGEQPDRPVADRLAELLRAMADFFTEDREFMAVVAAETDLFAGASGELLERNRAAYGLLAALLAQGAESGELRAEVPPEVLAEVLTGIFRLAIVNWLSPWEEPARREPLEARLLAGLEVFLHGAEARRRGRRGT